MCDVLFWPFTLTEHAKHIWHLHWSRPLHKTLYESKAPLFFPSGFSHFISDAMPSGNDRLNCDHVLIKWIFSTCFSFIHWTHTEMFKLWGHFDSINIFQHSFSDFCTWLLFPGVSVIMCCFFVVRLVTVHLFSKVIVSFVSLTFDSFYTKQSESVGDSLQSIFIVKTTHGWLI